MRLEIMGKRFLIKPTTDEVKDGQIIMPEPTDTAQLTGQVITIGSEAHDGLVKVSDKVLFSQKDSIETVIDGEKHYIVDYEKILAIIKEDS